MTTFWHWGVPAGLAVLLGTSIYSVSGLKNEKARAEELAATNQSLHDSLIQVQGQLQSVTAKMDAMTEQQKQAEAATAARTAQTQTQARRASARTVAASDARMKQIQDKITTQQKELESTQQDLASAKQDLSSTRQDLSSTRQDLVSAKDELDGKLSSTRDELSGGIAKNHEELVALQKLGQRNYYEFTIDKNKQFQRVGPMSVSLRRTNFKHKYFDMAMMVDDQQLEKKHVDLFEPVMIRLSDRPQPVELVVNEIHDNQIKGYVSEPKFKTSELAKTAAQ